MKYLQESPKILNPKTLNPKACEGALGEVLVSRCCTAALRGECASMSDRLEGSFEGLGLRGLGVWGFGF